MKGTTPPTKESIQVANTSHRNHFLSMFSYFDVLIYKQNPIINVQNTHINVTTDTRNACIKQSG